ncbi:hypothetical protein AERO8C_30209 [Aeromonas veronii]|uniref:Uncharacterized protein n=1 Tax=Aeromonas veronii TaxID=654 RepID=A0A653L6Z9_AERVE|nr:hypothetical protein AERO8C_30209 [Aeromonas veronii]
MEKYYSCMNLSQSGLTLYPNE